MSRRSSRALTIFALLMLAVGVTGAAAAPVKSRVVLVVPFDASSLETDDRWVGDAVAEVLMLGLVQHQAFIPLERGRLRAFGTPEVWNAELVQQAARTTRADVALFGRVTRSGNDVVIQPRIFDARASGAEPMAIEDVAVPDQGPAVIR